LLIAGLVGHLSESHGEDKSALYENYLADAFTGIADYSLLKVDPTNLGYIYAVEDNDDLLAGYVTITTGQGYGGLLTVVLNWSLDGEIQSISIPQNSDDKAWWDQLITGDFFDQYIGRKFDDALVLGADINAISGSTISCNGVALGVHAGRALVAEQLAKPYPIPEEKIKFGLSEALLIGGLCTVVLFRMLSVLARFRWVRYVTLFFGLGVLGIWLARPLSLTNFAVWIMGSPPHLNTNLFLYILVIGVVLLALIFGKNFYCYWLCPYSAVQEIAYKLGQVGLRPSAKWHKRLRNVRYFILWFALFFTILLGSVSITVFEPWGTLFSMKGSFDQWVLLGISVASGFFIYNAWCFYVCPVGAFMDIVLIVRRKGRDLWNTIGIPLIKRQVQVSRYDSDYCRVVNHLKNQVDIEGGVFGDVSIGNEEASLHESWVKNICHSTGIQAHLPLWNINREDILKMLIYYGFEVLMIVTDDSKLGKEWLGKKLDLDVLAELKNRFEKSEDGRVGYYHTLVVDGPIFQKRLNLEKVSAVFRRDEWGSNWYLDIEDYSLVSKYQ